MRDRLLTIITRAWSSVRSHRKVAALAAISVLLILVVFLIRFIGHIGTIGSIQSSPTPTLTPTPSPTPTPYPIAQGKQEYDVNTSIKSGPQMSKVTIDPLDARMGETQMVSVAVKSTNTVTAVMVALRTDRNVITNHQLILSSGTPTNGIWSGTWTSERIHDYLYQVIVTATDTQTSNSTTVTIR